MQGLERRGRAAKDDRHTALPCAPDRDVATVIANAFLLLERRIVLFVDDDEAEPWHRREHREPRAEHEVGLPCGRPPPRTTARSRRKATVQCDALPAGQRSCDLRLELRSQTDLRHEQ